MGMTLGHGIGIGLGRAVAASIPENPPEAGRLLYLLEDVGVESADAGTTVQSWTDPTSGRVYSAAAAGVRPLLIAPGFPRGDGSTDELNSAAITSQVLSAGEYFHAAVINPISIAQFGVGGNNAIVFADISGWFWGEVRQTAAASGLYEYVGGHWNAVANPQQQRQIRVPIVLGQTQLVWTRFKDGVVTAGVNSLAPYDNISANAIDNVSTATVLFGSTSNNTRQYNGDTRAVVSYGAHSDSDKNLAIQSLAQRFGITLTPAPALEEMVLFVVIGQSNGEGQGTTVPSRTTDPRIEVFGWDGLFHASAVEPLNEFKRQLIYRDYTPADGSANTLRTGFGMALADRLRALGETRRIAVLNSCKGGTSSAQWVASLTDLSATTALSPIAQLRLDTALARGNIKIGAVIINQGETDATDFDLSHGGWATNWTAIADRFVSRYAASFDKSTRLVLHQLYDQAFSGGAFQTEVRAMQAAWAAGRSDVVMVEMPDPPNVGDVHLETAALVTLGEDTANAWFAAP